LAVIEKMIKGCNYNNY